MAEISTIARPYAEALLKAVKESKEEGLAQKLIPVLDTIDEIVADPKLKELASDPSLSSDQIYELIRGMLDKAVPQEAENLLKLVIQNGRIEALPQITAQYRELLNHENKEADVTIETAFPLSDDQVADLIKNLVPDNDSHAADEVFIDHDFRQELNSGKLLVQGLDKVRYLIIR